MVKQEVQDAYFEAWYQFVCGERFSEEISYRKLLTKLHNTEFTYFVPNDDNRADDGIQLRRKFAGSDEEVLGYLDGPCSVFEMMVALAIRCETTIMDDPKVGDRTGQWFWGMIRNLGLSTMYDDNYDEEIVEKVIERLLKREYEADGAGGLFTVRNCDHDLRKMEIWAQMNWYLGPFI